MIDQGLDVQLRNPSTVDIITFPEIGGPDPLAIRPFFALRSFGRWLEQEE
jgi:hypothetical protein